MKAMSVIRQGMSSVGELVGRLLKRPPAFGVLSDWTERRFAKRASEEMLALYWTVRREHPQLTGRPLYEAVVARRLGPQSTNASTIVLRAEESFADWPVERSLRFRDVVHYLTFDEYLRAFTERLGTRTQIGYVVARIIPEEF